MTPFWPWSLAVAGKVEATFGHVCLCVHMFSLGVAGGW